ncbi:hypothetical protein OROGR_031154 [Orobanche gracilis]
MVSGIGNELQNVKKAAVLDADSLTGTVAKLGHMLTKLRDFLNSDMKNVEVDKGFHQTLRSFVQNTELNVRWLLDEEKRIMTLVKNTSDYFQGNAGKNDRLRLFVIANHFTRDGKKEQLESPFHQTRIELYEHLPLAPRLRGESSICHHSTTLGSNRGMTPWWLPLC